MARKIKETKNNVINFFHKIDTIIYEIGDKLL